MTKFKYLFIVLISISFGFSQQIYVPYKVGTKFGIADSSGKMVIAPKFDLLKVSKRKVFCFQGFNFNEDQTISSSLIINDKLILENQPYDYYNQYDDYIIAMKFNYDYNQYKKETINNKQIHYAHLYNSSGKQIPLDNFENFYQISEYHVSIKENIICAVNFENQCSIYKYNKERSEISETIAKNVTNLKVFWNTETNHYLTFEENGIEKKVIFDLQNNVLETQTIKPKINENELYTSDGYGEADVVMDMASVESNLQETLKHKIPKNALYEIITIDDSDKYKVKTKPQIKKISFVPTSLQYENLYLLKKGKKVGLYNSETGKEIIPPLYDEIIKSSMGYSGMYILKNNNKFGVWVDSSIKIEPIFDKIPFIYSYSFFGKQQHLIELYDENNTFFCYAKSDGTVFYKEK
jgi:WG containing repeat